MNPGETTVGNQPPAVNNTPPVKTPVEQQQAEQDAALAAKNANQPKPTAEQEAATAEAARVAGLDLDFIQGPTETVATVNAAIQLMRDAGMNRGDGEKVFGKAFQTGNLADIDRAALVAKVGEQKAALILAGITQYNEATGSTRMAAAKAVMDVMGGQENWVKVRTWARALEKADPAFAKELNEYRDMIDLGGRSAKFAAEELRKLYEADTKNSSLTRTVVAGDGRLERVDNPITSRQEYVKLLKQAHNKGDMEAVRQINARRQAGRALA